MKRILVFLGRRTMMKKLLVVLLVLAMATAANAAITGLVISVNGQIDPPETSISMFPSDYAVIDVHGTDGTAMNPQLFLLVVGPGKIAGGVILYGVGGLKGYYDEEAKLAEWEMTHEEAVAFMADPENGWGVPGVTDFSYMSIVTTSTPPEPTIGKLVDEIMFHCVGPGDVTLMLFDADTLTVVDTQVIHQIPEPATMLLLGLGSLLLRRRK
jgi:hypothetical protein